METNSLIRPLALGKKNSLVERMKNSAVFAKNRKGMSIGDIYPVMLTIALVAILIAVILLVLTKFAGQADNDSAAQNATNLIITQIADFVPWIGIILLIVAASIVIGILIRNLAGGGRV